MKRAMMVVVGLVACSLWAQEPPPKRDLSFLVPGKSLYKDVMARWRQAHADEGAWANPLGEWDSRIAREKPDINLSPLTVPAKADREGMMGCWLDSDPAEQAAWHIVPVWVSELSVVIAESPVDDPDSPVVNLVFLKDGAGAPDRLLYYKVSIGDKGVDWEKIVQKYGQPQDVEYVYVRESIDAKGDKYEKRHKYVFRRFPERGIGYVWDARTAEEVMKEYGEKLEDAQKDYYRAVIYFEPEKK